MCNEIGIRLEFDNADRPSSFRRKLTFELFSNVRNISFSYVGSDQLPLQFLLLLAYCSNLIKVFINLEYIKRYLMEQNVTPGN